MKGNVAAADDAASSEPVDVDDLKPVPCKTCSTRNCKHGHSMPELHHAVEHR